MPTFILPDDCVLLAGTVCKGGCPAVEGTGFIPGAGDTDLLWTDGEALPLP